MENQTNDRIARLRDYMREEKLKAFIIPSTDAHMSEYIPEYWQSRRWISGFTGSAGTVVVTLHNSGLWTDSRYFLQAADELAGSEIKLFKDRLPETITISDWLRNNFSRKDRIGIDGNVYPAKDALKLKSDLDEYRIVLDTEYDPFEEIWDGRPPLPKTPVVKHPFEFSGETSSQKIHRVLEEARKVRGNSVWISSLDTIAWLFNIRGNDVPYNPVVVAHAFISSSESVLFLDTDKITFKIVENLKNEGVTVMDYSQIYEFFAKICNYSVCLDRSKLSYNIYKAISERNWIIDKLSVADFIKSMKNDIEANGFRQAMVRDGVALTKFFMWLEKAIPEGLVTECSIGPKLKEFRGKQKHFEGESFCTIAGYAANGAIVHYRPKEDSCLTINPEGLLLIDSGGQYLDGTTDITRTIAVGPVTEEMKKDYTLVLKGMINLTKVVFPAGTRGSQIDMLARKAMWECGINYLHGTGHGVGHYLNVHEGPQNIRQEENPVVLQTGMVVTNEPGIYRENKYGIRTENMMIVKPAMTTEFGDFQKFETLTLCYIDTTLVKKEMMTNEEINWLNEYHQTVYEKLSPHLSDDEKNWLRMKTSSVES